LQLQRILDFAVCLISNFCGLLMSKIVCKLKGLFSASGRKWKQDVRSSTKLSEDLKMLKGKKAEKMKEKSAQRCAPAAVGQTVLLPVPEVDRGRADHRNVKAVVLEVVDGFYCLGTLHGKLVQLFARNQLHHASKASYQLKTCH
jgi:hypothetical protein